MEMTVLRILGIDTSGKIASVAITDENKLLCEKILYTNLTHSQIIMPMVQEMMNACDLNFDDIDAIAVANGPGSYTGLRIGIAAVKGICLGRPDIKCAGISTLAALSYNCSAFVGKIIPVMKARPNVVYVGEYLSNGEKLTCTAEDKVCNEAEFFTALDLSERIMLTGDYCTEIKEKYFSDNENIVCAGKNLRLQRASCLCSALENDDSYFTNPEKLEVAYLQATKAEKDKAHS